MNVDKKLSIMFEGKLDDNIKKQIIKSSAARVKNFEMVKKWNGKMELLVLMNMIW